MSDMTTKRPITTITPEPLPTMYVNSASLKASIWDFAMNLGTIVECSDDQVTVREDVRIIMSPQHAKLFATILSDHVARYEARYGRIPEVRDEK
jgi:hypothetical protein